MRFLLALLLSAATLLPAARPDGEIEADIKARFAKSKISVNRFEVKVRDGVAVITGHADVIQHKGVATRLAKLGGAKRVDNRIQISEAARAKASARLEKAREKAHRDVRSDVRSEARSAKRSDTRRESPPEADVAEGARTAPGPPPVRRAVVKR